MWDFDLQARYFMSSNDAWFGFAAATAAAVSEWQDQVVRTVTETEPENAADLFNPMTWWPAFVPKPGTQSPLAAGLSSFGMPQNPFLPGMASWPAANPWAAADPCQVLSSMFNAFAQPAPAPAFGLPSAMTMFGTWPQMWQPFSWTMYQLPLTAMMMANGMPHSVASPAAQASTSTLDALDAAREQASRVFSAYRSEGGHATAQILDWPGLRLFAMLPWVAPFLASAAS